MTILGILEYLLVARDRRDGWIEEGCEYAERKMPSFRNRAPQL